MARNFKTPKPRTFRLERFHLQGQHDQSTHGGGGTGSGRTLYGKNQVVQGSPTRETTKAPSQSERDVTGPVVRQTAEGTMTARGEDWDPDFTADEDVRGKVRGSGLGLAMCRRILGLHGGRIRVARTGPEGTTFELRFPRRG